MDRPPRECPVCGEPLVLTGVPAGGVLDCPACDALLEVGEGTPGLRLVGDDEDEAEDEAVADGSGDDEDEGPPRLTEGFYDDVLEDEDEVETSDGGFDEED